MKKLALLAVLVACGHKADVPPAPTPTPDAVKPDVGPPYDASHLPRGFDIRLSNGAQHGPAAADHGKPADARLLLPPEIEPMFSRMKPLAPAETSTFALRPASQPPPKPGETVASSFPAPPNVPPVPVETGELKVLRYAPEGVVPVAPQLTLTFSQPMVAVTSQTDAASVQPVKLTPQPKGTWRWIGTRTIVFDPDPRFAQATTFRVDVPAGTKSATGNVLAKAVSFSFETPPPSLISYQPSYGPQHLDVPMIVEFDQKVDPSSAMTSLKLKANGKPLEARLLTAAELAQLQAPFKDFVAQLANNGHWFAFRATTQLPTDATISATFASGLASAEGPNKTKEPQEFHFQTYSAFRMTDASCATACPPGSALGIVLDNPIEQAKFDDQLVQVTPAIPNLHVLASGSYVSLVGDTKPRTKYHVTIGRALTDEFGQTLAKDLAVDFKVGDVQPAFFAPNGLVVLDPKKPKPELDVFTTNYDSLDVQLYQVDPSDWKTYRTLLDNQWNHDHPPAKPGRRVADETLRVTHGANRLEQTAIDLAPALHDGRGDVVVIAEPSVWKHEADHRPMIAWVQVTKLGIDAHADGDKIVAYASDLETGKPMPNAVLTIPSTTATASTDPSGVATLAAPPSSVDSQLLVATVGSDHAFVASYSGAWGYGRSAARISWYVADDRQLYRPGERVALKGWLRDVGRRDVEPIDPQVKDVAYRVIDSQGNELLKGSVKLTTLGGFDIQFTLPKTPNLGSTQVELVAGNETTYHYVRVEEFRRPEFEVSAHAGDGPYVVAGAGADVTVDAKYYSGGPLAGADTRWSVSASPTSFTPPNRDDYRFGGFSDDGAELDPMLPKLPTSWRHDAKTDATGANVMHVDVASVNPATPISMTVQAMVTDMNHQGTTATTSLLVHPSYAYVGIKPHKVFVTQGVPFDVDVIGVGIDGKPLPGTKIALHAARLDWKYEKGRYRELELEPQTCDVVASQAAAPCHFTTAKPGTYRLVATISDARGRPNHTELTYWVAGGSTGAPSTTVTMIPDKTDYAVGETAHVLVSSPFSPAEGLVTWRRNGIVETKRVTFTAPSTVLDVPITEALVPNVWLHVDVVGEANDVDDNGDPDPKLPKRVAYASGDADLAIPAKTRTLAVTVTPAADKVAPGSTTSLAVKVVDATGAAVPNAEVAVIAVDESVLDLTGYKHPTPIDTFYAQRSADVMDLYSRAYVQHHQRFDPIQTRGGHGFGFSYGGFAANREMAFDEDDRAFDGVPVGKPVMRLRGATSIESNEPADAPAAQEELEMAETGKLGKKEAEKTNDSTGESATAPIAIRSNFDALALFAPAVMTGADGTASVELKLPDNLTRYRLVAIAAAGAKQFGKGESTLTARQPLMVRPSAPRFLNYGDAFRLPIVVQNQTDAAMTVRIAVRGSNVAITAGAGREVRVPANDRALVEIPMAAELAGTARLQIVGTAGTASDAAELSLPVWTPATTEAFATYGVIDNGAVAQPVALPSHVVPQFGGLEVSTASTNLQSLTDALLYLVHYPFDCAEQRASRIVGIAALRDEIAAFHVADLPSETELTASMADDLDHLANMQNRDGGFSYWDRDERSDPYLSVYVVDALAHAKAKGLQVPAALFEHAKPYLTDIEAYLPVPYYDADTRAAISAYALATRKLLGDLDIAKAQHIVREMGGADKLQIDTAGWLLQVFAGNPKAVAERAAIVRFALNRVSETAGAANFATSYGDAGRVMLASDRRADAVMLEALIEDQKTSDLIPKIVTGLLAHRTKGRWDNTQEDSFVLVALDHYFRVYEKITPDFVARVWLGSDYAGDHKFAGRTSENHEVDIAMVDVARHDHSALTIAKDGAGRLYYRIGMKYAPADLVLAPADYGFAVQRRYEAIDDPSDVVHAADGTWHIKAGARVRIRVAMVNDNRRYQVALVDPLPAGLEPLNPELATTGTIPSDPKTDWWGVWYQHQNLRDDRAEAFTSYLWEGTHQYTYVARATTPGNFIVPPPKAEEMYAPETFGRGASDRVIVE